ncbi:MAG: hypothetical protein IIA72_03225 [Proteobacteria bacterium]|nr:hypothetical protein [Pseudomonadota bacterium]
MGPYSRPHMLAKLDGRTKEARQMEATVAELADHVGGEPTALQARLIDRIARLELYLSKMDQRANANGSTLSERDSKQYLAWCNSLRLAMRDLGLERRAAPGPSLAETLGQGAVA